MKLSSFKPDRITIALLFFAVILCYNYFFFAHLPRADRSVSMLEDIVSGNSLSPYKYRVLFPYIEHILQSGLEYFISTEYAFDIAYFILIALSYFLSLFFSFKFFSLFHSRTHSFILATMMCFSFLITHYKHFIHPWSMIEPALFSAGFILAYQRKPLAFFLVVVLATLNRETGVFLSAAYLLTSNSLLDYCKNPRLLLKNTWGLTSIVCACVAYVGLRQVLGETDHAITFGEIKDFNTRPVFFLFFISTAILYFHPYLLYQFKFDIVPHFLKRQLPIFIICCIFIGIFGIWQEIRMFNSVLPLYLCTVGFSLPAFLKIHSTSNQ